MGQRGAAGGGEGWEEPEESLGMNVLPLTDCCHVLFVSQK